MCRSLGWHIWLSRNSLTRTYIIYMQQHRNTNNVQELGVDVTPRLQTVKVEEPPKRKGGIMVSSIEELVDKLKNEAKVL